MSSSQARARAIYPRRAVSDVCLELRENRYKERKEQKQEEIKGIKNTLHFMQLMDW